MILNIERRSYTELNEFTKNEETHYIYTLVSHKGGCENLVKMFSKGILSVNNFTSVMDNLVEGFRPSNFDDKESKDELGIYLMQTNMVDNGDYTFNGEDEIYEPYYEEEISYLEINNCPFCKEDIIIHIYEKEDVTIKLNKLKEAYYELSKKKSQKAQKERAELYNKIIEFKSNDLTFK